MSEPKTILESALNATRTDVARLKGDKLKLEDRHQQLLAETRTIATRLAEIQAEIQSGESNVDLYKHLLDQLAEREQTPQSWTRTPEQVQVDDAIEKLTGGSPPPGTRHRKSKPDPVKAARKAARQNLGLEPEPEQPTGHGGKRTGGGSKPGDARYQRDPLVVHARSEGAGLGKSSPKSRSPQPMHTLHPSEVTLTDRDKSPTVEARCELLLEILDEMAGRVGTAPELTQAWAALLDVKVQTAQTQVSQCLRILYSRERVVFTDLVERDNGRRVAQYKLVVREGAVV